MNKSLLSDKSGDDQQGRTKKTVCVILVAVLVVVAIIALIVGLSVNHSSTEHAQEAIVVQSDGGRVKGLKQDGVFVFKGIPYAKPPTRQLRWKPPQACKEGDCWSGMLDATKFGSMCTQKNHFTNSVVGDENCLFLNVWTPAVNSKKKRPVLLYIHGGSLISGSGNAGFYTPLELIKEMDIVGITINYRLNAFGFLALDALAHDSPTNTSGNYGFMDQILALTWVKNNIEKFGGDPERVTLIGQSSGGTSELALLTSPLARGLFHRAIVMSASPVFNKTSTDAAKDNEIFLRKANCSSGTLADKRACLYNLTSKAVVHAVPWSVFPYWAMTDLTDMPTAGRFDGALATVDGYVVPVPPLQAMATGVGINDVPIIIGNTAQEVDFLPVKDFSNSTLEEFANFTRTRLLAFNMSSAEVDEAIAMYVQNSSVHSSQLYFDTMVSDMRVICPTDILAKNASTGFKSDVYRYIVTNWPSKPVQMIPGIKPSSYAFHIWDLDAFFGFPQEFSKYTPSARDERFMKDLRREFGSFIHTGQVKSAVSWKTYPEKTGLFTGLNGLKVVQSYHKKECKFWMDRGFFSYAWIN